MSSSPPYHQEVAKDISGASEYGKYVKAQNDDTHDNNATTIIIPFIAIGIPCVVVSILIIAWYRNYYKNYYRRYRDASNAALVVVDVAEDPTSGAPLPYLVANRDMEPGNQDPADEAKHHSSLSTADNNTINDDDDDENTRLREHGTDLHPPRKHSSSSWMWESMKRLTFSTSPKNNRCERKEGENGSIDHNLKMPLTPPALSSQSSSSYHKDAENGFSPKLDSTNKEGREGLLITVPIAASESSLSTEKAKYSVGSPIGNYVSSPPQGLVGPAPASLRGGSEGSGSNVSAVSAGVAAAAAKSASCEGTVIRSPPMVLSPPSPPSSISSTFPPIPPGSPRAGSAPPAVLLVGEQEEDHGNSSPDSGNTATTIQSTENVSAAVGAGTDSCRSSFHSAQQEILPPAFDGDNDNDDAAAAGAPLTTAVTSPPIIFGSCSAGSSSCVGDYYDNSSSSSSASECNASAMFQQINGAAAATGDNTTTTVSEQEQGRAKTKKRRYSSARERIEMDTTSSSSLPSSADSDASAAVVATPKFNIPVEQYYKTEEDMAHLEDEDEDEDEDDDEDDGDKKISEC